VSAAEAPVFVWVDLLEDFFADPLLSTRRDSICAAINDLSQFARSNGWSVVWIRQEFEPDLSDAYVLMRETGRQITIRGTPGCEILRELDVREADRVVVKKRYSAFFGTQLAEVLRAARCGRIVLGGVNTHACVRATAVDAYQRDYRVILAAEAIASYDDQYHNESMRYLAQSIGRVMTNAELKNALGAT
jgi:nicotinamidase-related amidase